MNVTGWKSSNVDVEAQEVDIIEKDLGCHDLVSLFM